MDVDFNNILHLLATANDDHRMQLKFLNDIHIIMTSSNGYRI